MNYCTHDEFPDMVMLCKRFENPPSQVRNRYYFHILRHLGRKHNYIVALFDMFITQKKEIIIIQECCSERDVGLVCARNKKPIDESLAQRWAKDILKGLDFLGDNGICHRGISPKAILLQGEQPKVSRLYSAHIYWNEETEDMNYLPCISFSGSLAGSFHAPEVTGNNQKEYFDPVSADIWSLGAVLFHIIAWPAYPFKNESSSIEQEIQKSVSSLKVSSACQDFLSKTLTTEVLQRYQFDRIKLMPWVK